MFRSFRCGLANLPEFKDYLQPVIAKDKVRYVGEPIAVVVAETQALAEDALAAIDVDIERLPALPDRHAAASDQVAAVRTDRQQSCGALHGGVRRCRCGLRQCRVHAARELSLPSPDRIAARDPRPDRRMGRGRAKLTVFGATKVLFFNRRVLAPMLGVAEDAIDMIEVDVGGGFGVRGEFYPEDFLIPFAARLVGRPVKWIEDRREHLIATNHSREVDCEIEIACTRDGTILGMRGHVYADMGAYIRTNGGVVPAKAAQFLPGPYRIRDVALTVEALVTSKTPVGTLRAPGRFEANFFRERLLDMVARDLEPRSDGVPPQEPDHRDGAAVRHRQARALRARNRIRHRRLSRHLRARAQRDRLGREEVAAGPADRRPLSRARRGAVRRKRRLGQGECAA